MPLNLLEFLRSEVFSPFPGRGNGIIPAVPFLSQQRQDRTKAAPGRVDMGTVRHDGHGTVAGASGAGHILLAIRKQMTGWGCLAPPQPQVLKFMEWHDPAGGMLPTAGSLRDSPRVYLETLGHPATSHCSSGSWLPSRAPPPSSPVHFQAVATL